MVGNAKSLITDPKVALVVWYTRWKVGCRDGRIMDGGGGGVIAGCMNGWVGGEGGMMHGWVRGGGGGVWMGEEGDGRVGGGGMNGWVGGEMDKCTDR